MLLTDQIRNAYINYFVKQGHLNLPSASLIPINDPSLLFTNSGMVPFKDFFTGVAVPPNKTLVTCQKCLRAGGKHNDLDNVGYTARHHTFFEMLGNFSFGGYFKEGAIFHAWELITKDLGLSKEKLSVTVYHDDEEAVSLWKKIAGFSDDRITRIDASDNFWSMGDTGPCGPCSEIFYDKGEQFVGDDRFLEIWNLVFMQFERFADGSMVSLSKPCIDTGMGLERVSSVLQNCDDNYKNDVFQSIINATEKVLNCKCDESNLPSFKVVADHLRAACFAISDGILPGNEGREYVIRRIIRRGICHMNKISDKQYVLADLVPSIVSVMGDAYPELKERQGKIQGIVASEEEKFSSILNSGLKILKSDLQELNLGMGQKFPGDLAFKLHDTFGFPIDVTEDILRDYNISVDMDEFDKHLSNQRDMARSSQKVSDKEINLEKIVSKFPSTEFVGYDCLQSEARVLDVIDIDGVNQILIVDSSPFYAESGGQIGDNGLILSSDGELLGKIINTNGSANQVIFHHMQIVEGKKVCFNQLVCLKVDEKRRRAICANHSATHLLNHALRKVVNSQIVQKGSLVSDDKLRFDFNYNSQLSYEQIGLVEKEINDQIVSNYEVFIGIMAKDEAIKLGAQAIFGEKYGDLVRVVKIRDSIELCGGTHVEKSSEIGVFKIMKVSSVASGVRRIEAVAQQKALDCIVLQLEKLNEIMSLYNENFVGIVDRLKVSLEKEKALSKLQIEYANKVDYYSKKIGDFVYKVKLLKDFPTKSISRILSSNAVSLVLIENDNENIIGLGIRDVAGLSAKEILGKIFIKFFAGSKFGGTESFAQGRVGKLDNIYVIISYLEQLLSE